MQYPAAHRAGGEARAGHHAGAGHWPSVRGAHDEVVACAADPGSLARCANGPGAGIRGQGPRRFWRIARHGVR
jgi:hypothetical protein